MSHQSVSSIPNDSSHGIFGAVPFPNQLVPSGYVPVAQQRYNASDNTRENESNDMPKRGSNGAQEPTIESKSRIRKACDSCSIRKIKCDETGPPCRACAALEIPCTFGRPSRRRGPPNRHAQAIKRRRFDSLATSGVSVPSSPTHAAQTLASFSQQQRLPSDAILPFPILQLLLDDYFMYIHPMTPVPHEPSFRAALERREDVTNPTFLALMASMIGCVVASFPRRPRLHLRARNMESIYENSASIIDRCHKTAVEACGLGYLDKTLSVHDAVISYLQGLVGAYTSNWQAYRVYFGQCLTIIRIIGLHKDKSSNRGGLSRESSDTNFNDRDSALQEHGTDFIFQELGKRIFWIIFAAVRSLHRTGISCADLCIPPATPSEPYPSLPLEVDDLYIKSHRIVPQPQGVISMMKGFNDKIKMYSAYDSLATLELAYGVDQIFDWNLQKRMLEHSLHTIKQVLRDLPLDLTLDSRYRLSDEDDHEYSSLIRPENYQSDDLAGVELERRRIQLEIQKVKIYAHQLGTRAYLVEKYWNLQDGHKRRESVTVSAPNFPGIFAGDSGNLLSNYHGKHNAHINSTGHDMEIEREDVVKDLVYLLTMINPNDMKLNGASFTNQIRQIAAPLLNAPHTRKGAYALRAETYILAVLSVLTDMERLSFAADGDEEYGAMAEGNEDKARRGYWAELRVLRAGWVEAEARLQ